MELRPLRAPVLAIALTGVVSLASALCLLSSDLPAADANLTEMIMTRSNTELSTPSLWRRAVQWWRAAILQPRPADELRRLDDRALRDIGLARAEIDSVDAESRGCAPLTRLRIAARRAQA